MAEPYKPRKITRKWIEVKELRGTEKLTLVIGQRVLDTKIMSEAVSPSQGFGVKRSMPEHKVVIVLECVEFEDDSGKPRS